MHLRPMKDVKIKRVRQVVPEIKEFPLKEPEERHLVAELGTLGKDVSTRYVLDLSLPKRPDGKYVIAQMELTYDVGTGTRESSGPIPLEMAYTSAGHGYVNAEVMRHIDEVQIFELNNNLQKAIAQDNKAEVQQRRRADREEGRVDGCAGGKEDDAREASAPGTERRRPRLEEDAAGDGGFGAHGPGHGDTVVTMETAHAPPTGGGVPCSAANPAACRRRAWQITKIEPSALINNKHFGRIIMVKCPFCGFSNEDGALFCEQCKSDLSAVPAAAAESVPVAEVIEATPVTPGNFTPVATAEVVQATLPEAIPAAEVITAAPVIPEELPEPLPAMAPPLEKEIMAAEAAQAVASAPADCPRALWPPPAARHRCLKAPSRSWWSSAAKRSASSSRSTLARTTSAAPTRSRWTSTWRTRSRPTACGARGSTR